MDLIIWMWMCGAEVGCWLVILILTGCLGLVGCRARSKKAIAEKWLAVPFRRSQLKIQLMPVKNQKMPASWASKKHRSVTTVVVP
jgi:hypothetical protein